MKEFFNYLKNKYGKTAQELSKSHEGNVLVETKTIMISLDDMAKKLKVFNKEFKEDFATADALHVVFKNNKIKLFFIEFKNIDFSIKEERLKEKYQLKDLILEIDDEDMRKDFLKYHDDLIDKSMLRLRMKPYDSLSLLLHFMEYYFKDYSKDCVKLLFEIEKNFVLISKTKTEYNPLFKNKSNRNNNIIKPLRFLKRLVPYHYNNVLTLPDNKSDKFIYMLKKS